MISLSLHQRRLLVLLGVGLCWILWFLTTDIVFSQLPPMNPVQTVTNILSDDHSAVVEDGAGAILSAMKDLESRRDPKCDASANRLENMVYGLPFSQEGRWQRAALQTVWLAHVWRLAADKAQARGAKMVTREDLQRVVQPQTIYQWLPSGDLEVHLQDKEIVLLKKMIYDHYSSVGYSLRSLLAAYQETMVNEQKLLLSIDHQGVLFLKEVLDVMTLTAIQTATRLARQEEERQITAPLFTKAWQVINVPEVAQAQKSGDQSGIQGGPLSLEIQAQLRAMMMTLIDSKITAYGVYNKFEDRDLDELLLEKIAKDFAKVPVPADPQGRRLMLEELTAMVTLFTQNVLQDAHQKAQENGHRLIRAEDIFNGLQVYMPHVVDDQERVVFFPRFPFKRQIQIEPYDPDSFRDFAIHWDVIRSVLQSSAVELPLNMDPFAAEVLAEGVSDYAVLLLRVAGMPERNQTGAPTRPVGFVSADQISRAAERINRMTLIHQEEPRQDIKSDPILSASGPSAENGTKPFFRDQTQKVNIHFTHRPADWYVKWINQPDENGYERILLNNSGVAAGDVNADDYPDILLVGGKGNQLLLNDGHGHFRDVTKSMGIVYKRKDGSHGEPRQPIIADFDNDGWQDILITYVGERHRLYRNLEGKKFEDISERVDLGGDGLVGGPATVFDYDRDGLLDIYIGYYGLSLEPHLRSPIAHYISEKESGKQQVPVRPSLSLNNRNASPNRLWRNLGDMRFEDVTEHTRTGDTGWTTAVGHSDLNGDGWQDLVVANDFGTNTILMNQGDGRFVDASENLGVTKTGHSMNVGFADLNRDGFPDFYISNINSMLKNAKYMFPSEVTEMDVKEGYLARLLFAEKSLLYMSKSNNGRLEQFLISDDFQKGSDDMGWAWDAEFFDFDNDGDDDLYICNGFNPFVQRKNLVTKMGEENLKLSLTDERFSALAEENRDYNLFFVNQNNKLVNLSDISGLKLKGYSSSAAYLDYDRDGDLDIILSTTNAKAVFYENHAAPQEYHWLMVKLIGDPKQKVNRDAIGAWLTLKPADGLPIWREIHGGSGYLSMDPKEQHFGLGKATQGDLSIRWPNGEIQEIPGLKANCYYKIRQGQGIQVFRFSEGKLVQQQ
jgi:histone H3/H4